MKDTNATSRLAIVGAIVALSAALARNDGGFDVAGLGFVAVALVLALGAALGVRVGIVEQHAERSLRWGIGLGVLVEAYLFVTQPLFSPTMAAWILPATALIVCGCVAIALLGRTAPGIWVHGVLVAAFSVMAIVAVAAHPDVVVDVRNFQEGAAQALLVGEDPYTVRYRNIYSHDRFYGDGTVDDGGWLTVGFIYPPLVALLGVPGALAGDVRFSHALSLAGAALAMGLARPGRVAVGAVALFALMPRGVYLLAGGWSEPMSILLLGWVVWAACRSPRLTGALTGLLLASKQYLLIIAPLLWLLALDRRGRTRFFGSALAAAVIVTLPFAVWHPAQFFDSVVGFHLRQPFRMDSLSFMAALARVTGEPSRLVGLGVLVAVGALAVLYARRAPPTPSSFALGVGLLVLTLFAFSQQAFGNYYAFAHAALCAALASSPIDGDPATGDRRRGS